MATGARSRSLSATTTAISLPKPVGHARGAIALSLDETTPAVLTSSGVSRVTVGNGPPQTPGLTTTRAASGFVGQLDLPAEWGKLSSSTMTMALWFGARAPKCSASPRADVYFSQPVGYAATTATTATLEAR